MTISGAATGDSLPTQSDPRYRYYQQPPKTVFLKWKELADLLPAEAIIPEGNHEAMIVGLPAEEIFQSITPRIRYTSLVALLPEGFLKLPAEKHQEHLHIPAARIAKHYQLITLREQLPEPPKPAPPVAPKADTAEKPSADTLAPAKEEPKTAPQLKEAKDEKPPEKALSLADLPSAKESVPQKSLVEKTPATSTPATSTPATSTPATSTPATSTPATPPPLPPLAEGKKPDPQTPPIVGKPAPIGLTPIKDNLPKPSFPPKPLNRPSLVLPKPPTTSLSPQILPDNTPEINPQQKRRLFDRLPLFRKKPAPPAAPASPPALIQPTPEQIASKLTPPASPLPKFTPPPPSVSPAASFSPLPSAEKISSPFPALRKAPPTDSLVVENQPESSGEERARNEIPDQESLQALFMTEEPLTIERTVELCSTLPGIRACILARGSGVIASANVPNGIDILNLSTNAMTMLRQMQDSLQKMGIGSIPAVTLHSEKGPVSVLPHEDLCFLVVHKDRSFIPGVRQRLLDVLHQLGHANLPLAIEEAAKKTSRSLY